MASRGRGISVLPLPQAALQSTSFSSLRAWRRILHRLLLACMRGVLLRGYGSLAAPLCILPFPESSTQSLFWFFLIPAHADGDYSFCMQVPFVILPALNLHMHVCSTFGPSSLIGSRQHAAGRSLQSFGYVSQLAGWIRALPGGYARTSSCWPQFKSVSKLARTWFYLQRQARIQSKWTNRVIYLEPFRYTSKEANVTWVCIGEVDAMHPQKSRFCL
jgi:hypothetical protein